MTIISTLLKVSQSLIFFNNVEASCDASVPWQLSFQDPATPLMSGIIHFHNDIMVILVFIAVFVLYMMTRIYLNFNLKANKTPEIFIHGTLLEIV
jgi:cytochrome c oxidase subunit 2